MAFPEHPASRHARLWGGPMDGATVFLGSGDLPDRVGMHRTADDRLVPIRGSGQLDMLTAAHVEVYEHATSGMLRGLRLILGRPRSAIRLVPAVEDLRCLYVHRDLATRWLAHPQ